MNQKNVNIVARYDFDAQELESISKETAAKIASMADIEEEKRQANADFNARIKKLKSKLEYLASCTTHGFTMRDLECEIEYDMQTGMKHYKWVGDGRIVKSGAISTEEMAKLKQTNMFGNAS